MRSKINRPVAQHKTSPQQEWYDLGYSDALEDGPDLDSKAYDTGYKNGLEDGRKNLHCLTNSEYVESLLELYDHGCRESKDSKATEVYSACPPETANLVNQENLVLRVNNLEKVVGLIEDRLSKIEACLAALTLGNNRNQQGGGTI